jgi:cell division septation protein DedD
MAFDKSFATRLLLILLAVVILVVLITQYNKRSGSVVAQEALATERFENASNDGFVDDVALPRPPTNSTSESSRGMSAGQSVKPSEHDNEDFKAVDFETENKLPSDCFPRAKTTVQDLLPKDAANTTWAQVTPAGQGELKDQNFLSAGHHVGINTVGQSMRNPNLQLRSEPPNPKMQVSPWNQSTMEYDTSRRHFELGEC